jgi:hypothetical protein
VFSQAQRSALIPFKMRGPVPAARMPDISEAPPVQDLTQDQRQAFGQGHRSGPKDKMRSSKSRSRSKANRPRTLGNIINRVFDSSGPEGKVRGTPQQIIEKYQILARDAQLSNDRVAAENFLQHAEHYTRMLGEAMREMAAEQEQRRPQDGQQQRRDDWQSQQQPYGNGNGGQGYGRDGQRDQPRQDNRPDQRGENRNDQRGEGRGDRPDYRADYRPEGRQPAPLPEAEVIDLSDDAEAGLVETPEARSLAREAAPVAPQAAEVPSAEAPAKPDRGPRRPRGPRKPRPEGTPDEGKRPADTQEAAE